MTSDMAEIPGGQLLMGSDRHYPEERPARMAEIAAFRIAKRPVTNAQFARFVESTGYRTSAETPISQDERPGFPPEYYRPGSLVFQKRDGPVSLADPRNWWTLIEGACWRHPEGPGSNIADRMDHPVVHVSYFDAKVFADWAGLRLPGETEWEWAAYGGATSTFPWGEDLDPGGGTPANIWIGAFPWRNDRHGEGPFSTPVGSYPANGFGLFDMIGNVWEWTISTFDRNRSQSPCCVPASGEGEGIIAVKGGSFLCAESYCRRYRPAARSPQEARSSTSNIGFRCAADL